MEVINSAIMVGILGMVFMNLDEENDRFLLESIASVLPSPQKDPISVQKMAPIKPSLLMKTIQNNGEYQLKPLFLSKTDQNGSFLNKSFNEPARKSKKSSSTYVSA